MFYTAAVCEDMIAQSQVVTVEHSESQRKLNMNGEEIIFEGISVQRRCYPCICLHSVDRFDIRQRSAHVILFATLHHCKLDLFCCSFSLKDALY